jgi:hypothetical protein
MRRLTPFLLLAVLVLGTGLGIGLGLAGAPSRPLPGALGSHSGAEAIVVSVRPAERNPRIEWVTLRLPYDPAASYSCSVVLRHSGSVVGRSGFNGPLPGDGISLPIKVSGSSFAGTSSDVTAMCASVSRSSASPASAEGSANTTAPRFSTGTASRRHRDIPSAPSRAHRAGVAVGPRREEVAQPSDLGTRFATVRLSADYSPSGRRGPRFKSGQPDPNSPS